MNILDFSYKKRVFINRCKELLLYCSYSIKNKKKLSRQLYVAMIDGRFYHGGLSDRLKGAISLYAYCKATSKEFRLNFTSPFDLSMYLLPNMYDWRLKNDECIVNDIFNSKTLLIINEYRGERLFNLKSKKQIHYYNNRDIVDMVNSKYGTAYTWGELFNELFIPSQELKKSVSYHRNRIGKNYISVVFRFQQLLGDFKEYDFPTLNKGEKLELINKCIRQIKEMQLRYSNTPLLVTSDSITFLNEISNLNGVYTLPGNVVHIDVTKNADYKIYEKSFLDFIMLSQSEMVFCVGTKYMYPSEFPLYASKINNIPFKRILIK